jgi:hypothetical protein
LVRSMGHEFGNEADTETEEGHHAVLRRINVHRWMVDTLKSVRWLGET